MTLDFESAVAALHSTDHQARSREAIQLASARRVHTISDMREYLRRARVDLHPSIAIVHVTGTKGKGSTACLCESILRVRNKRRTGLFTSPHLVDIRERVRIGGLPVSKAVFGQAYWNIRRMLEEHVSKEDDPLPRLPGYFRMMVLLALYIFANYEPSLDVIILEVGMGGRFDATNIYDMDSRDVVCGVTLLDLDHTRVLGGTLEEISWEKGGIFQVKKGSPLYGLKSEIEGYSGPPRFFAVATNTPSVLKVLEDCARNEGLGGRLCIVHECPDLHSVEIGLPGSHQRINGALATALCNAITRTNVNVSDDRLLHQSLRKAFWPGRCQTIRIADSNITLRLDGAHTPISLQVCITWYLQVNQSSRRVLIFNCHHERDPVPLLLKLHKLNFSSVHFCPADFERPSGLELPSALTLLQQSGFEPDERNEIASATWQGTLSMIWRYFDKKSNRSTSITSDQKVRDTLNLILSDQLGPTDVMVAGSLYLVGSVLSAVKWKEPDAGGKLSLSC